jgi:hypothetical protein
MVIFVVVPVIIPRVATADPAGAAGDSKANEQGRNS